MRFLFLALVGCLCVFGAVAQETDSVMRKRAEEISKDTLNAQDTTNLPKETRKSRKKKKEEEEEAKPKIFKDSARLSLENVSHEAVRRSLIIPGWGQVYNAQQWRLRKAEMKEKGIVSPKLWWISVPVIYGGFVSVVVAFNYNNRYYQYVLGEVQYRLANNDQRLDETLFNINTDYLIRYKDSFRRDRDLCILLGIGVYAINVIEAYVNGMFMRYDIQDDLSLRITPTLQQIPGRMAFDSLAPGIKLTFAMR